MLSTAGKIFAIVYSIIGIPLILLYLGQCSKALSGLVSGNKILTVAAVAVFVTAVIYDITEDSDEDTVSSIYFLCLTLFLSHYCRFIQPQFRISVSDNWAWCSVAEQ